ncbi:MAG: hypothetical protein ACYCW6_17805 [Candidatus Xenobia bacterium]
MEPNGSRPRCGAVNGTNGANGHGKPAAPAPAVNPLQRLLAAESTAHLAVSQYARTGMDLQQLRVAIDNLVAARRGG